MTTFILISHKDSVIPSVSIVEGGRFTGEKTTLKRNASHKRATEIAQHYQKQYPQSIIADWFKKDYQSYDLDWLLERSQS